MPEETNVREDATDAWFDNIVDRINKAEVVKDGLLPLIFDDDGFVVIEVMCCFIIPVFCETLFVLFIIPNIYLADRFN